MSDTILISDNPLEEPFHIKTDDEYFLRKVAEIFKATGAELTLESAKAIDGILRSVATDTLDGFMEMYHAKASQTVERYMLDREQGESFLSVFKRWLK